MTEALVLAALRGAIRTRQPKPGVSAKGKATDVGLIGNSWMAGVRGLIAPMLPAPAGSKPAVAVQPKRDSVWCTEGGHKEGELREAHGEPAAFVQSRWLKTGRWQAPATASRRSQLPLPESVW